MRMEYALPGACRSVCFPECFVLFHHGSQGGPLFPCCREAFRLPWERSAVSRSCDPHRERCVPGKYYLVHFIIVTTLKNKQNYTNPPLRNWMVVMWWEQTQKQIWPLRKESPLCLTTHVDLKEKWLGKCHRVEGNKSTPVMAISLGMACSASKPDDQ